MYSEVHKLLSVLVVGFFGTLDNDQEVRLIGRNHHFVFFAGHTQESQVVRGVQITDQVAGLPREHGQPAPVVGALLAGRHRGLNKLGHAAFLVLLVRHDQKSFHALVNRDSLYSLFHFTLNATKKQPNQHQKH